MRNNTRRLEVEEEEMKQRLLAILIRKTLIIVLGCGAISLWAQNAKPAAPAPHTGMAGMQTQGVGKAGMAGMKMTMISNAERKAIAARLAAKRQAASSRPTGNSNNQGNAITAPGSSR